MNCDVQSLLDAAKCFKCVPTGMLGEVQIYLLCQWLKKKEPIRPVDWEPDTVIANWRDSGGNKTGDLATFSATADLATTDRFSINDPALTAISGLSALPILASLDLSASTSLTSIDLTGCTSLNILELHDTGIVNIDASPCTNLTQISTYDNFSLLSVDVHGLIHLIALDVSGSNNNVNSINVAGCSAMTSLLCGGTQIAALDVSTLSSIVTIDCNNCVNLTGLNCNGLSTLTTLNCYSCALTTLTLTGCTGLDTVQCYSNPGLTTLDCTGLSSLATIEAYSCAITTLTLTGCSSLSTLDCYTNALATINVLPCTSLLVFDCSSNALASLDVHNLASLGTVYCNNNSLTSLNVSGCSALSFIDCSHNSFPVAASDSILSTLDLIGLNNGSIDLSQQTPPMGLDVAGYASRANLIAKGWVVTVTLVDWTPAVAVATWVDTNGTFNGDLANFQANADIPTVSSLAFAFGTLTSLQGLISLPALVNLSAVGGVNKLSVLDLYGCLALVNLTATQNNFTTIDLSSCSGMTFFDLASSGLTSINIGNSTSYNFLGLDGNALTTAAVDGVLSNLRANCLLNSGQCDLTLGTNSAPTLSCINPLSDCFALNSAGWTVTTN